MDPGLRDVIRVHCLPIVPLSFHLHWPHPVAGGQGCGPPSQAVLPAWQPSSPVSAPSSGPTTVAGERGPLIACTWSEDLPHAMARLRQSALGNEAHQD